jgi:hypothetical protein
MTPRIAKVKGGQMMKADTQNRIPTQHNHQCGIGRPEKGYRVQLSPFRSVFVAFRPFSWTCECEDFYFNSKNGCGYECRHIRAVKALLASREEVA